MAVDYLSAYDNLSNQSHSLRRHTNNVLDLCVCDGVTKREKLLENVTRAVSRASSLSNTNEVQGRPHCDKAGVWWTRWFSFARGAEGVDELRVPR